MVVSSTHRSDPLPEMTATRFARPPRRRIAPQSPTLQAFNAMVQAIEVRMRGSYAVRSLQEWDAIRTEEDTMNPLSATTPVSLGFGDRLYAAMREHGPVCVGIDPHASLLAQWGLERRRERCARVFSSRRRGPGWSRRSFQATGRLL